MPRRGGDDTLVSRVAHIAWTAVHRRSAGKVVCDNPGSSVRSVMLQAFNTEGTKDHEAAQSGSDDKSAQAVLQQPGMEIQQQTNTQPAHAEIGQNLACASS